MKRILLFFILLLYISPNVFSEEFFPHNYNFATQFQISLIEAFEGIKKNTSNDTNSLYLEKKTRKPLQPDLLVLFYLIGERTALQDLQSSMLYELHKIGSTKKVVIIGGVNFSSKTSSSSISFTGNYTPPTYQKKTSPKIFEIRKDKDLSYTIPLTKNTIALANLIKWAKSYYLPKYIVLFMNMHGSILGVHDNINNSLKSSRELGNDIKSGGGVDMIILNNCNMQNIETQICLRGSCEKLLAFQTGVQMPFAISEILVQLNKSKMENIEQIKNIFMSGLGKSSSLESFFYGFSSPVKKFPTSFDYKGSVINTNEAYNFFHLLIDFIQSIKSNDYYKHALMKARDETLSFQNGLQVDICDLLDNFKKYFSEIDFDSFSSTQRLQAKKAFNKLIQIQGYIKEKLVPPDCIKKYGNCVDRASGISIFFPHPKDWKDKKNKWVMERYQEIYYPEMKSWFELLESIADIPKSK